MNGNFNIYQLIILFFVAIILVKCGKEPQPPDAEIFKVYDNTLMPGFDIGISDSDSCSQHNWLTEKKGYFEMNYPAGLDWGCVYIVTGLVPFDSTVYEDFSNYRGFSVDLRGESGGEYVGISIEDYGSKSSNVARVSNLFTDWHTYQFSLESFPEIDLKRLRVITKFLFFSNESQTIDFRNLRFYTSELPDTNEYEYYIVFGNNLMNGYSVGCNSSDSLKDWIEDKYAYWEMDFPPDQLWATLFLSKNEPEDFSMFEAVSFEIKGKNGGEKVHVGINDILGEDPGGRSFVQWTVSNNWEEVNIPLSWFKGVNLNNIYIPVQFVIFNTEGQTIYFRNVRYIYRNKP
jgi:hypothetical protein